VKNEKGFSHILLIILVVLAVAGAGVIGWWAYQRVQKNNETPAADSSQAADTEDSDIDTIDTLDTASTVPEGYTLYENETYGVQFAYPSEWGTVSTAAPWCQTQGHLTSGSGIIMSFSDESHVTAGIRTSDWQHDPAFGHGGSDNSSSLAPVGAYTPGNLDYLAYDIIKDDATGFFGLKPLCQEGGCYSMGLVLIHSLSGNTYTTGIAFVYTADYEANLYEDATQAQADALPWGTYFSAALIDQFEVIDGTIDNL
jgi:hypothetical protein